MYANLPRCGRKLLSLSYECTHRISLVGFGVRSKQILQEMTHECMLLIRKCWFFLPSLHTYYSFLCLFAQAGRASQSLWRSLTHKLHTECFKSYTFAKTLPITWKGGLLSTWIMWQACGVMYDEQKQLFGILKGRPSIPSKFMPWFVETENVIFDRAYSPLIKHGVKLQASFTSMRSKANAKRTRYLLAFDQCDAKNVQITWTKSGLTIVTLNRWTQCSCWSLSTALVGMVPLTGITLLTPVRTALSFCIQEPFLLFVLVNNVSTNKAKKTKTSVTVYLLRFSFFCAEVLCLVETFFLEALKQ